MGNITKIILFNTLFFICSYSYSENTPYYFRKELINPKENSYLYAQEREKLILPFHKDKVERKRQELIIKSRGKVLKIFKDWWEEGTSRGESFSFVDINEDNHCILVEIQYYESGEYILLNYENGQIIAIDGIPIWSPSNTRFVVLNEDWEVGHTPNIVQIQMWQIDKGKFIKEWDLKQPIIGGDKARWVSNNYVKIRTKQLQEGNYLYKILYCQYENNRWTISDKTQFSREKFLRLALFRPLYPGTTFFFEGNALNLSVSIENKLKKFLGFYSKGPWTQDKVHIVEFYSLGLSFEEIYKQKSLWMSMINWEGRERGIFSHLKYFSHVKYEWLEILKYQNKILELLNRLPQLARVSETFQILKRDLEGINIWDAALFEYFQNADFSDFHKKLSKQFRYKNPKYFDELIKGFQNTEIAWQNLKNLQCSFFNRFVNESHQTEEAFRKLLKDNDISFIPEL